MPNVILFVALQRPHKYKLLINLTKVVVNFTEFLKSLRDF